MHKLVVLVGALVLTACDREATEDSSFPDLPSLPPEDTNEDGEYPLPADYSGPLANGCAAIPAPPPNFFGDRLFLGFRDEVAVYDGTAGSYVQNLVIAGGEVWDIERSAGNAFVWVVDGGGEFAAIDARSLGVVLSPTPNPLGGGDLTINANRQEAYMARGTDVSIQSTSASGFIGSVAFPRDIGTFSASPTMDAVYLGYWSGSPHDLVEWNPATNATTLLIDLGREASESAITRDGSRWFASASGDATSTSRLLFYDFASGVLDQSGEEAAFLADVAVSPTIGTYYAADVFQGGLFTATHTVGSAPSITSQAVAGHSLDIAVNDAGDVYVLTKTSIERYRAGNVIGRTCLEFYDDKVDLPSALTVVTNRWLPTAVATDLRERWTALLRARPLRGWHLPFVTEDAPPCADCSEKDVAAAQAEAVKRFPAHAKLEMRDVASFLRGKSFSALDVETFLDDALVQLEDG